MSKSLRRVLAAVGLMALSCAAQAHVPHVCPDGVIDEPEMKSEHVEQNDLVNWVWSTEVIFTKGGAIAESRFNECDGQGRPATTGDGQKRAVGQPGMIRTSGPEGTACNGCHAQPRSGGAGDFVANTFNGTEVLDPVTTSIDPSLSNERNTTGMFGAGFLELLAREMTAELQAQAASYTAQSYSGTVTLTSKGVSYDVKFKDGVIKKAWGIDKDLIVKPFGAGGTVASIRQFTVEAFNRHHGMQAEERYDKFLDDPDFDEDGVTRELTIGDISVVSLWQAMLDRPIQEFPDDDDAAVQRIKDGKKIFKDVGCNGCHVQKMTLNNRTFCEPGPYNIPGIFGNQNKKVCLLLNYDAEDEDKTDSVSYGGGAQDGVPSADTPLDLTPYTDLKRHHMCDDPAKVVDPIRTLCNENFAQGRPDQDGYPGQEFFMTADLWQVGESGPFGHDGHFNSLSTVIQAHGGEARASRDAYSTLVDDDQLKVIEFLKSLKIKDQSVRLFDG